MDWLEPNSPGARPRRVVVLGTGTEIGKTYVAADLARACRARGARVLALKPVESGVDGDNDGARGGDAGALWEAAGHGAAPLYALREPVSPHLAGRRAGRVIELEAITAYVAAEERAVAPDLCVIETAGGAFSPLSERWTNVDLAWALEPDGVILVAPDRLGVLHDVGATLRALGPRRVDMLVLCAPATPDASTGTNLEELRRVVLPLVGREVRPLACSRGGQVHWFSG